MKLSLKHLRSKETEKKLVEQKRKIKSPSFDLSTRKDIDKKLDSFCENFKKTLDENSPSGSLENSQIILAQKNQNREYRGSVLVQARRESIKPGNLISNINTNKVDTTIKPGHSRAQTNISLVSTFWPNDSDSSFFPAKNLNFEMNPNYSNTSVFLKNPIMKPLTSTVKSNKPTLLKMATKEYNSSSPSNNFLRKLRKQATGKFDNEPYHNMKDKIFNDSSSNLKDMTMKVYLRNSQGQKRSNGINPLLKKFGNLFIASLMEALVLKAAEDIQCKPIENDINLSSKILKTFHINPNNLKFISTAEERRSYIIELMNKTINGLIESWKQKMSLRAGSEGMSGQKMEEEDPLNWLHLESKYDKLEKNLKKLVLQKIYEFDEQLVMLNLYHQSNENYQGPKKSLDVEIQRPGFFENVGESSSNTMNILKKMSKKDSAVAFMVKNIENSRRKKKRPLSVQPERKRHESMKSLETFETSKDDSRTKVETRPISKSPKEVQPTFVWDDDKEKFHSKIKSQSQNLFNKELRVDNYSEIVTGNLGHQLIIREQKKNEARENIITKYEQGFPLTQEEKTFLVNTSELLNSCINKERIQDLVKKIDKTLMNDLEIDLAEKIISAYKDITSLLGKERQKYLIQKNLSVRREIDSRERKKELETQKEVNLKKKDKFKRMATQFLRKIETKLYEKSTKIPSSMDPPLHLSSSIKESQKRLKILSQPNIKGFENQTESMKLILKRHQFHPSSKILRDVKVHTNERFQKKRIYKSVENQAERKKKDQEELKITLLSPNNLRNKGNFVKFYTGGPPTKNFYQELKPKIAYSKKEMLQIIKIQAVARGFIARIRYLDLLENKFYKRKSITDVEADRINVKSLINSKYNRKKPIVLSEEKIKKVKEKGQNDDIGKKDQILWDAVLKGLSREALNEFEYFKVDVNLKDNRRNTPLFYAAKQGNLDLVDFLLSKGANPNEVCEMGNTAVHEGFRTNDLEVILRLIEGKGDYTVMNHLGKTPIEFLEGEILSSDEFQEAINKRFKK